MERLAAHEARLHLVFEDRVDDPALARECRRLLSPEETARLERLAHEERRSESLAARAVCRSVLSLYADVPPQGWRFAAGAHGRPEVAPGRGAPALRFSLTHTRGLIACLVTAGADAGVDAEDETRAVDAAGIAERFFAPSERRALAGLPAPERARRFFECWTLKEAYLKARGLGLALPLDSLAFDSGAGGRVSAAFGPAIGDEPGRWRFELLRPSPRHVVAAAVRRPPRGRPRLTSREHGLRELVTAGRRGG